MLLIFLQTPRGRRTLDSPAHLAVPHPFLAVVALSGKDQASSYVYKELRASDGGREPGILERGRAGCLLPSLTESQKTNALSGVL